MTRIIVNRTINSPVNAGVRYIGPTIENEQ